MKKLLSLALAAVALAGARPALAQNEPSPARLQAADQLLAAMHADSVLQRTIDAMMAAQVRANPMMAPYENAMRQFFDKYLSWEQMRDDMRRIYAETYTKDEMHQLAAFYQTPLGKRLLETTPQIGARSQELTQARLQPHMMELMQTIMGGVAPRGGDSTTVRP